MTGGSSTSNVGNRSLYEAGDQRTYSQKELEEKARLEPQEPPKAHKTDDSKDSSTLRVRAEREQMRPEDHGEKDEEAELSKKDPTLPARSHGNEPSKGAKIDAELQAEEEAELKKKGKA
ncbi:MAG: hypothetical protein M1815_000603 [Lichina confinis]|nr:MAG: hypothetical protein M1815_000603 [Lichina confinis]